MSFLASYQFIVQLHQVFNLGIESPKLFSMAIEIYQPHSPNVLQRSKQKNYAYPYRICYNNDDDKQSNYAQDDHSIQICQQASISNTQYHTSMFLLKNSCLNISSLLDDIVVFQMETEVFPNVYNEDPFIEFKLIEHSLNQNVSDHKNKSLKSIHRASALFKINLINQTILSYAEQDFDSPYSVGISFTVFSCVLKYKFRTLCQEVKKNKGNTDRNNIQCLSELIDWSVRKKMMVSRQKVIKHFYNNFVVKLRETVKYIQQKLHQNEMELKYNFFNIKCLEKNLLTHKNAQNPEKRAISLDINHKKQYIKQQSEKIQGQQQFSSVKGQQSKSCTNSLKLQKDQLFNKQILNPKDFPLQYILQQMQQLHLKLFNILESLIDVMKDLKLSHLLKKNLKRHYDIIITKQMNLKIFKSITYSTQGIKISKERIKKQRQQIKKLFNKNNLGIKGELQKIIQNQKDQYFVFYSLNPKRQPNTLSNQRKSSIDKINIQKTNIPLSLQNLKDEKKKIYEKNMLIVICHGFQGSANGMKTVEQGFRCLLPQAKFLVSQINQQNTDGEIASMGIKLSIQIALFIKDQMDSEQVIVNFVGHSLGGIIARASIPHLQDYKLGFYCSLCSPHIGYMNGISTIIKAGLWAIGRFQQIESICELQMQEQKDPKKTFLYKLSMTGSLRKFKKVILFSSFEDEYVPWHSARLSFNSQNLAIQNQMIQNILGDEQMNVHRLDIDYNIKIANFDTFIGRTAHINIITYSDIYRLILYTLPGLFDLNSR